MKRILVTLVFCCAALSLLIGTPAFADRVSGLTQALEQLPSEDLQKVLENLGVSTTPAPVPKTGQTTSYATGDDGDLEKGVAWPNPRFTDNGDGTVTDNLTGLVWMKNASSNYGALGFGSQNWANACAACNGLEDGENGLADG